jgi:hypothetical protein
MQMKRFIFIRSVVVLGLAVVFSKIYQQNRVIKLQYEKQRLERQNQVLSKKYNNMLVVFSQAKDFTALKKQAELEFGMAQLQLSHLVTFTGEQI